MRSDALDTKFKNRRVEATAKGGGRVVTSATGWSGEQPGRDRKEPSRVMGMLSLDLGVRSVKSRRAIDSDLCTLLQACELSREQTESRGERAGGHTAGGRRVCEPGLPGRAAGSDRACRSLSPASTSPSALHSPRVGLSSHVWFWGVLPDHEPQAGSRARSAGWDSALGRGSELCGSHRDILDHFLQGALHF